MTIYFAGSEPDCVTGNFTLNTTGAYHDANYVRCALALPGNTGTVTAPLASPAASGFWFHWYIAAGVSGEAYHDIDRFVTVTSDSGGPVITTVSVDNAVVVLRCYESGGGHVDLPSFHSSYVKYNVARIDLHYWQDGADVRLDAYVDGTLAATGVVEGTVRAASSFSVMSPYSYSEISIFISEIIVADASTDTRNLRVGTYYPSADGTHTDGTGSYADLDEIDTDGNAVTLAAVGDAQSVALTKHGTQPLAGVLAIAVNGLVASDGVNDLQAGLRIAGTDYYSADLGVGATPEARSVVFNAHPGTGGNLPQDPSTIEAIWKAVTPA